MTKSRSILDVIGLSSLSQAKKETLIQMTILSVACILGMKGIYSSDPYFSNEFDWDWNYDSQNFDVLNSFISAFSARLFSVLRFESVIHEFDP